MFNPQKKERDAHSYTQNERGHAAGDFAVDGFATDGFATDGIATGGIAGAAPLRVPL